MASSALNIPCESQNMRVCVIVIGEIGSNWLIYLSATKNRVLACVVGMILTRNFQHCRDRLVMVVDNVANHFSNLFWSFFFSCGCTDIAVKELTFWLIRIMSISSRFRKRLKHSSTSLKTNTKAVMLSHSGKILSDKKSSYWELNRTYQ